MVIAADDTKTHLAYLFQNCIFLVWLVVNRDKIVQLACLPAVAYTLYVCGIEQRQGNASQAS